MTRTALRICLGVALAVLLAWPQSGLAQGRGTNFAITADEPVQVDGDRLEVLEDQGRAIFEGNVRVVQGQTVMRTGRLVIHYARGEGGSLIEGGSAIERLEASNGVNIQSGEQVATGERAEYDMASATLTLSGQRVTLSEAGNVATGCRLTVNMRSSRARLEGCGDQSSRPTILIQPRNR
ncbi:MULTISPECIES: LptA/OstA family protein [unclassified Roseitalea]|uniref:LptA/OstA family protein n=1 Tax=unclassified Roseitalea TaxID=2639107 RepID=UPI0027402F41|nr:MULTISPECIES: LptA/OstA family protein [unclassified Roseitalea]